jgi:hypothetical protein
MVLTVSFELSLVIGLCCHHHQRDCRSNRRPLDISVEISGPHDFAVRLLAHSSAAPQASTASLCPTFVTIAKRPSLIGHGIAGILPLILAADQLHGLRPINTTGKSGATAEIVSSDEQLLRPNLCRVPDAVQREHCSAEPGPMRGR